MIDLILRNAVLPSNPTRVDLAIENGKLVELSSQLEGTSRQEMDLEGRLVIPGFVDPHVHLDLALMNSPECPGRPEPFGSVGGLNESLERRRRGFTAEEIERRAGDALKLASRHGITAMRAQCHVDLEVGLQHMQALLHVKEKYAGLVTLQIVAFPQQGLRRPGTLNLFREAFRMGADVMGGASNLDRDPAGQTDFRQHIDTALAMAMEMDVDLDIHTDLGLLDQVELEDLEIVYLARKVLEKGYLGRVTAGHACALDSALPAVAEQAIQLVQAAQISVISQPDLYRLGRDDKQHVRRGLTRVKQLLSGGVNVAFASNNVRDVMRPLGNFNPLEEALVLAYGAHMDSIDELNTLMQMCTNHAAKALHLNQYGLQPGCQADLVVLDAATPSAAIVGQVEKLAVFKAGRVVATNRVVKQGYEELVTNTQKPTWN